MHEPTTVVREIALRGDGENDKGRPAQGRVLQKRDCGNYAGQAKPKAVQGTTQARLRGSSQRLGRFIRTPMAIDFANALIERGDFAVST